MKKTFILFVLVQFCNLSFAQLFPDSKTDGKYYSINGKNLWVVTVGNGKPLVLISGGPGDAHYFLREFDSLASTSTLIYFDGFGRGKSDTAKILSEYSLSRDIEDVEGLRKALGYQKINILGHSYGTIVAQGYAIKYQQNLDHLVLISPTHSNEMWQKNDDSYNMGMKTQFPEIWDSLMVLRKLGFRSSDPIHYNLYFSAPSKYLYYYNPTSTSKLFSKPYPNSFNIKLYYQIVGPDGDFIVGNDIGRLDYRDNLKDITVPILIIAGRYDKIDVPRMMIKYKEYAPKAKFVMMEKSGHNPFLEEPTLTFDLIRNFLIQ